MRKRPGVIGHVPKPLLRVTTVVQAREPIGRSSAPPPRRAIHSSPSRRSKSSLQNGSDLVARIERSPCSFNVLTATSIPHTMEPRDPPWANPDGFNIPVGGQGRSNQGHPLRDAPRKSATWPQLATVANTRPHRRMLAAGCAPPKAWIAPAQVPGLARLSRHFQPTHKAALLSGPLPTSPQSPPAPHLVCYSPGPPWSNASELHSGGRTIPRGPRSAAEGLDAQIRRDPLRPRSPSSAPSMKRGLARRRSHV